MIKKIIILFVLLVFTISAQKNRNLVPFSSYEFTVLGGIGFENTSNIFGSIRFEGTTNTNKNIFVGLFAGYYKSISLNNYKVNSYKYFSIDDTKKYQAISYNILQTDYQVIPLGIVVNYNHYLEDLIPYIHLGLNYNLIDAVAEKSIEEINGEFNSFDELPSEFRGVNSLLKNSFAISCGIGTKYNLSTAISLNIRYLYIIDSELENTHQVLIGFSI